MRRDLSHGVAAAQLVHAAGESSPGGLLEGTYAIVLVVDDEDALTALARSLAIAGVAHVPIIEPDRGHEMTAIGVVPGLRSKLRRYFSTLPLYGGAKG